MSEMARIAQDLRKQAAERSSGTPADRRAALLEVLRRELDPLPPKELYGYLAEIRSNLVKEVEAETEAAQLWECVTALAALSGESTTGKQRAVTAPGGEGLERIAGSLLGPEMPAGTKLTPEQQERLVKVLTTLVEVVERSDQAYQFLSMELRKTLTDRDSKGTIAGIKMELEEPLRKVLARAVLETGDPAEVEARVRKVGGAAVQVHRAYQAGLKKGLEAVRKVLDPQVIERDGGKDPRAWWLAYRKIYKNEAYEFGHDFQIIFLEKNFLNEYFDRLKKL